jgi:hypothetical protein
MTEQAQEQTVLSIFKQFPGYAFDYGFGLVLAIISDITLTSMALGSFFLGWATTPVVGLAVFFLAHTVLKGVNALNGAIVQQGRLVAQAGVRLAQVFGDQAVAAPKLSRNPAQDPSSRI